MAQVQHGDVDYCGFVDAAVVTDCKFPASEGNLYSPKLYYFNISVTWKLVTHGDTQKEWAKIHAICIKSYFILFPFILMDDHTLA